MPYVEVDDGVSLYVQELDGGRTAPDVVLVAGFGLHHQVWDREVRVLTEQGHRVLCVDQRGHGRSDKPLHGYEVDQLARDLETVLDRCEVTDATLVGWSFGGQVAFRVAASADKGVARLALVGSNGVRASRSADFPFGMPPEPLVESLTGGERADRIASRRRTIRSGFGAEPAPDVLDWLLRCSLEMPSWAAVACYHSMLETDLVADIPKVRVPVLQLIGADDPVHSAKGARWLNERLADAELVELPGCGHYPMIEAPEHFDRALAAFARGATR
jgi:non-heme chloroperoxidase